jgi:hypothetical protein
LALAGLAGFGGPRSAGSGCNGGGGGAAKSGSGSGTKRIIFVTNGDDPFWDACLSGLKEGEKLHELAAAGLRCSAT